MNAHTELRMDAPGFLRWAEGREGRHELVKGKVRSMVGASGDHVEIAVNLVVLLRTALDRARYRVTQGDFAVEVGDGIRYPDAMVSLRGIDEARLSTRSAVFIAEVLSPSSVMIDLREKLAEYTALPSLRTYLILAQDDRRAWTWERGEDGSWPDGPAEHDDPARAIPLPALGLTIILGDLYAGVGLTR